MPSRFMWKLTDDNYHKLLIAHRALSASFNVSLTYPLTCSFNILKMDLFLLSMATSFLLFPNIKNRSESTRLMILLKPIRKPGLSETAFFGKVEGNVLKGLTFHSQVR